MKRIKTGAGFAVFIIFFAIAVFDAFRKQDWLSACFWLFIGVLFILADNLDPSSKYDDEV